MIVISTKGICPKTIIFDINDGKVHNVKFVGGCNGQGKAVAKLIDGMEASKVVEILEGIECGNKGTSCSDQLAKGIKEYIRTFKE